MDNIFKPLIQGAVVNPFPPKFHVENNFCQLVLGTDSFSPFAHTLADLT